MVDPITIAAGIANITATLPVIQDTLIYMANFAVSNTAPALMIGMQLAAFAWGLITGLFRRRRGRR